MQQQPNYYQQPAPKKSRRRLWIVLAIVGGVLVLSCAICGAVVAFAPQTQQQAVQPTQAPATATTAPTHVPTVTPKPKATVSLRDQVDSRATNDAKNAPALFGTNVNSNYFTDDKSLVITETLGESLDNGTYKTEIKSDCFGIQQAIWTDKNLHLSSLEIHILGPLVDKYGNTSSGMVGSCTLKDSTVAQFNWGNLDYNTAWDNSDYDSTWLLPSLNS